MRTFARNDPPRASALRAIAVLHANTRQLNSHPHGQLLMPAAPVDRNKRLWRTKGNSGEVSLFSGRALAKVYRAKVLAGSKPGG